jgi:hypothetical protein
LANRATRKKPVASRKVAARLPRDAYGNLMQPQAGAARTKAHRCSR